MAGRYYLATMMVPFEITFFTNQATVDTINWLALQGTSGGLAGNEWPSISEAASDTINDSGAWAVK